MADSVEAGAAGGGFAPVADEVRRLTQRSAEVAHEVGSSIADLTSRLDVVLSEDADFQDRDRRFPPAAETAMTRRLGRIASAQRDVSRMAGDILHETAHAADQVRLSSDALFKTTIGAMAHVQFQDISRQMLEHVSGAVADVRRQYEDLSAYARGELAGEEMLERAIQVEDLRAKHVMSRQRTTHASRTGAEVETTAEPQIELF
jgi:methyl-accepting chemotaxis protein